MIMTTNQQQLEVMNQLQLQIGKTIAIIQREMAIPY